MEGREGVNHLFVFNSILVDCRIVAETMSNLFGGVEREGVNHLFVFNSILVNCEIVAGTMSTFPFGGSIISLFLILFLLTVEL